MNFANHFRYVWRTLCWTIMRRSILFRFCSSRFLDSFTFLLVIVRAVMKYFFRVVSGWSSMRDRPFAKILLWWFLLCIQDESSIQRHSFWTPSKGTWTRLKPLWVVRHKCKPPLLRFLIYTHHIRAIKIVYTYQRNSPCFLLHTQKLTFQFLVSAFDRVRFSIGLS